MTPCNFSLSDAHKLYDNALHRWDRGGPRTTMGTVVHLAREGGYEASSAGLSGSFGSSRKQLFYSDVARPNFNAGGMPPRPYAHILTHKSFCIN